MFSDLIKLVRPGDIFAVQGSGLLSRMIQFGQWLDDCEESPFSHIGGFIATGDTFTTDGTTIESRSKIARYHFSDWTGCRVMIARHKMVTPETYALGIPEIYDNLGQYYPTPRLLLHAADMLRAHAWRKLTGQGIKSRICKFSLHGDWPVCSELWAQFFCCANLPTGFTENGRGWRGISPDDFYDAWRTVPEYWEIIFDGVVEK